jgi:16S rRNA (guanine527-N7)-methyltransferase
MSADVEQAIDRRLRHARLEVDRGTVLQLATYLTLLARWNRRINLTAFDLDRPTEHAIDRLIVEPVVAARDISLRDRVIVDVGSGGGSPALPLKILRPHLRMTLVEARVRKTAFLREAARGLGLEDVQITTVRLDRRGLLDMHRAADLVTMRAVRMDADVLAGIAAMLAPEGRLLWFGSPERLDAPPPGWLDAASDRDVAFLRILKPRQ